MAYFAGICYFNLGYCILSPKFNAFSFIKRGREMNIYQIIGLIAVSAITITHLIFLSLNKEIALELAAKDVRIQAPIPGKSAVGIEVANKKRYPVYLKEALESIYDNQTRKPDEIVVVFDGPLTDELHKVLDDFYTGKEEVVFYYPQEVGLS